MTSNQKKSQYNHQINVIKNGQRELRVLIFKYYNKLSQMIQIAHVPYKKIYKFAYFSDAMFLKALLYILSIIIAFFLVYSVNNFYLSFNDNFTIGPQITYDYNYHLVIQTDASVYTYSSLYKSTPFKSIALSHENNINSRTHTFTVNWPKSVAEKVQKVSLLVFMQYTTNNVANANGVILAEGTGYDISDLNIVGTMQIKKGMNTLQNPPTSNLMAQYNYNAGSLILGLQQNYKSYLSSSTSFLATNMPNNLMKFSLKLKSPSISSQEQSASILGQVVWTFSQFFPIACVLWFGSTWLLSFVLRENVIKRVVIHDNF